MNTQAQTEKNMTKMRVDGKMGPPNVQMYGITKRERYEKINLYETHIKI